RILTSVTVGEDVVSDNGIEQPGDTILGNCHRLVIGGLTLASSDATLGGYGFLSGQLKDSSGKGLTTPGHHSTAAVGYRPFVLSPALGNYGTGVNVDGSFTLGLPAGTYVLSVAKRGGQDDPTTHGPQATPVTVTVTAGQTTKQDMALAANPDPNQWGELTGT